MEEVRQTKKVSAVTYPQGGRGKGTSGRALDRRGETGEKPGSRAHEMIGLLYQAVGKDERYSSGEEMWAEKGGLGRGETLDGWAKFGTVITS